MKTTPAFSGPMKAYLELERLIPNDGINFKKVSKVIRASITEAFNNSLDVKKFVGFDTVDAHKQIPYSTFSVNYILPRFI